jgi:hypothetical protein
MALNARLSPRLNHTIGLNSLSNGGSVAMPIGNDDDDESSSSQSSQGLGDVQMNGGYMENKGSRKSLLRRCRPIRAFIRPFIRPFTSHKPKLETFGARTALWLLPR